MASSTRSMNLCQKWKLDLSPRSKEGSVWASGGNPPGFSSVAAAAHHVSESASRDTADQQHLLTKRGWEMALGPLKQLPMNLFIMYMAGNSISIFPIMMVGMMLVRPAKALLSLNATFKSLQEEMNSALIGQKFVYILGNMLGVGLALYKCFSMGLLPTHPSDWLDFLEPAQRLEYAAGGFSWF